MSEFQLPASVSGAKEFLTKKEKVTGNIAMLILLAMAGGVLYVVLPYFNIFLSNMISAVGKLLVLGGLGLLGVGVLYFLQSPRFKTLMWHWRSSFYRSLTEKMIKHDPIGRMRAFADEFLEVMYEKFQQAQMLVEKQLEKIRKEIERVRADHAKTTELVQTLRKYHYTETTGKWDSSENEMQFGLKSQRIRILEDTLKKLEAGEVRLDMVTRVLQRIAQTFRFKIEATRQSADFLEIQYNSARSTADALRAASAAWGFGDMAQLDVMTRKYIEDQTSGFVGEIEVFLKAIPELTSLNDLENEAAADEMMQRLREWETAADTKLQQAQAEHMLLTSGDADRVKEVLTPTREPELVPVRKYRGLLGSRDPKERER